MAEYTSHRQETVRHRVTVADVADSLEQQYSAFFAQGEIVPVFESGKVPERPQTFPLGSHLQPQELRAALQRIARLPIETLLAFDDRSSQWVLTTGKKNQAEHSDATAWLVQVDRRLAGTPMLHTHNRIAGNVKTNPSPEDWIVFMQIIEHGGPPFQLIASEAGLTVMMYDMKRRVTRTMIEQTARFAYIRENVHVGEFESDKEAYVLDPAHYAAVDRAQAFLGNNPQLGFSTAMIPWSDTGRIDAILGIFLNLPNYSFGKGSV